MSTATKSRRPTAAGGDFSHPTPGGDVPFEGDYTPAATDTPSTLTAPNIRVEPLQIDFLHRLADALNTTLDLNTLMHRVADLVRAVIDYRIFAILLLNDRTHELWMRFQTGHKSEVERIRVKLGRGITGTAALERRAILVQDVTSTDNYINANPNVRSELAVPLIVKNRVIGVLDLQSEIAGFFTPDHQRLLELTASRMAVAIENARLYTRVTRQAQTLTVLHEISREITSILDPDDLLERIGVLLKRVIDFHMFTILLWNSETELFEHRFSTRYGERVTRSRTVAPGNGLIGTAARERAPILTGDVRKDPRYVADNPETRSELSVPLLYKGQVIGVVDLEHTKLNHFTEDHQRTLTTLASQIAISIVNASLYKRLHEAEQRMERDLDMAREVQLRLLPPAPPQPQNAEIAVSFRAARSIGGDLYDFLDYDRAPHHDLTDPDDSPADVRHRAASAPSRLLLTLGDVSGKAAPAALYAALVSGLLRSLAPRRLPPAQLLSTLNAQLQERHLESQYVTLLAAMWTDETRTLRVANAGAQQPLIISSRGSGAGAMTNAIQVRTVEAEGFPLGLFPVATYQEMVLTLEPGDLLVMFSDGITDATNSRGVEYGVESLSRLFHHHPTATRSAQEAIDATLEAVTTHRGGAEHFDDETMLVLRVL